MMKSNVIKSPLRYPGGKSRLVKTLAQHVPCLMSEYREPFVGAGHFMFYIRQHFPDVKVWINDINPDLIAFWKEVQRDSESLANEIRPFLSVDDQRGLYRFLIAQQNLNQRDAAIRFYILNRISYGGNLENSGYSARAERFKESHVNNLSRCGSVLEGVKITCGDYSNLLQEDGKHVFIYCDPPYFTESKFYGKKAKYGSGFDYARLFTSLDSCPHHWLLSINHWRDSFDFARNYGYAFVYTTYGIKPRLVEELLIWRN